LCELRDLARARCVLISAVISAAGRRTCHRISLISRHISRRISRHLAREVGQEEAVLRSAAYLPPRLAGR